MFKVQVSPIVSDILTEYAGKCAVDNGMECALHLVECFDKADKSLQELPQCGAKKIRYIPARYHVITFWIHLWLVYQIDKNNEVVMIDYLIDDRSDYGSLF